jgi:four helix bundle protein
MSEEISNRLGTGRKNGAQSYRDLLVWQKGMALAKEIYKLTVELPTEEKFGLISQMRRATVSVPSNIAEGQARNTTGEFVQFISHAEGSLAELDTQLTLAVELDFLSSEKAAPTLNSIAGLRQMLNGLRRAITGQKHPTHHSPLITTNHYEE